MTDGKEGTPACGQDSRENKRSIFQIAADLLFPPKCMFCGRLSQSCVCEKCRGTLPFYRGTTGHREFFSECTAAFRYEGDVRSAILRFKFGGFENYAAGFGKFIAEAAARELTPADIAAWVPSDRRRLRKRGYDQAELLTRETAKNLGIPAVKVLEKVRNTARQSGLRGKARRAANVIGAFKAEPGKVKGKTVLLIDDVVTTGATLSECARELLMAGAKEVVCAAAACAEED